MPVRHRAAALPAAAMDADDDRRLGDVLGQVEVAGELHPVVLDIVDVAAGRDLVLGERRTGGESATSANAKTCRDVMEIPPRSVV